MPSVANYHTLGGLKRQKFVLYSSRGQKYKFTIPGQKSRYQQIPAPNEA